MAQWNLTSRVVKYLDAHLALRVLDNQVQSGAASASDIEPARSVLLSRTLLFNDRVKASGQDSELKEAQDAFPGKVSAATSAAEPFTRLLANQDLVSQLLAQDQFTESILNEHHNVSASSIDALFTLAKLQYENGNYDAALKNLQPIVNLSSSNQSRRLNATWGALSAAILAGDFDTAVKDFKELQTQIDSSKDERSQLEQLEQRCWLLHWGLFLYFNPQVSRGRELLLEVAFGVDKYVRVAQTRAPWLLRYLTIALVLTKQRHRDRFRDLLKVIEVEYYQYTDPITEFVRQLAGQYDFQAAEAALVEAEVVLKSDPFIASSLDTPESTVTRFLRQARELIVENFCKIHSIIEIAKIADMLNTTIAEAEQFLVGLITAARLDAKIDSQKGIVVISPQERSVHQQLIEKTKGLDMKANVLAGSVEKARAQKQMKQRSLAPKQ